jgi:hypothetical protein
MWGEMRPEDQGGVKGGHGYQTQLGRKLPRTWCADAGEAITNSECKRWAACSVGEMARSASGRARGWSSPLLSLLPASHFHHNGSLYCRVGTRLQSEAHGGK